MTRNPRVAKDTKAPFIGVRLICLRLAQIGCRDQGRASQPLTMSPKPGGFV